jgi:multicomponent Na+:H+ antiporter subunit D
MRCCPIAVDYVPYTAAHVLTQLQLLLFSGLAFFVMLDYLKRTPTITLDTDWLWRVAGPIARVFGNALRICREGLSEGLSARMQGLADAVMRQRRPGGLLLRSWPTGSMALWVMVMLLAYLLFYYAGNGNGHA